MMRDKRPPLPLPPLLPRAGLSRLGLAFILFLAACGSGNDAPSGPKAPLVEVEQPRQQTFVDELDAVGTARANEQVTISSPVAEKIERLYFDDGQYVRKGQLIAVLSQEQERASLAAALATMEQAKTQLERIETLNERGFATRAQLDTQIATMARAKADADDARARIADRTVRAPFSGAVSLRNISAGSIVSVGDPIATVSDVSQIKLDFTLPEQASGQLKRGQLIEATSAAWPGARFTGRISTIDPVIDPNTRAITVRAVLPNPGARLKPGMLMEVKLRLGDRQALAVPELSVVGSGSDRFVYVLDAENIVHRANITTGKRADGFIEVSGIPADARVVTEGVVKVTDGTKVSLADDKGGSTSTEPVPPAAGDGGNG